MNRIRKPPSLRSWVIASGCLGVLMASLQVKPVVAKEGPEDTSKSGSADGEEKRKSVRMPFLTAAIQGGLIFFSGMEVSAENDSGGKDTLSLSGRAGVILKLHLNLLGSGLAIEINPFFAQEWVGDVAIDHFSAVGAQIGLAYRFHIRRFFPKIGIGAHIAYAGGGDLEHGLEAFGRLPVGFTVYMARFLAFDLEAALLTGATGIQTKNLGNDFDRLIRFDYNTGLEVVIGLRFP